MTVTVLKALLQEKRLRSIHDVLSMYNPVDLAELLSELDDRELATVFRILEKPKAAEVFTYMDNDLRQELIKTFSSAEIKSLFEELYADDAADFLSDMPANFVTQLLENVGPETRQTINHLLQYPDDSAGIIMTVEFVELDPDMTVSGALEKIRRVGIDSETVYNCYAVKKHKLLGVVTAKDLLTHEGNEPIEPLILSDFISVKTTDDREYVANLFRRYGLIALPVVDKLPMNSEEDVDLWKWAKPEKPLFVENLGQLVRGANMGSLVEVGPHLPITNAASLSVAAALGAHRVWLSPELSLKQIAELGKDSPVELGIVVCGNQELMTCEHCLLMSQGACNQKCSQCERRAHAHTLLDRKGYRFPVVTDCFGRSHLYNAVRFDAAHVVDELIDAGVSAFMVDTTLMSANEAGKATSRVVRAIEAAKRGTNVAKAEGCTTGHLFRGVQ